MNINTIVAALKERCPSFGPSVAMRRFAGSAEYAALSEAAKLELPSGYVIPMDDEAFDQESSNGYQQRIREVFAVVVVLDNKVDERGQTSIVTVESIKKEIWSALLGWAPDAEHDRIEYDGGQLMNVNRAHLYYQFEFTTDTTLGEEDTYQAVENAALPAFEQVGIQLDAIDPFDPNLAPIGPDGRIEVEVDVDVPQS